jgi:hypothetical protein
VNFWAFLFLLIVFTWIGINSNTEAGKLARLLVLAIIERFACRHDAKPMIGEKKPYHEGSEPCWPEHCSRGKGGVPRKES